MLFGVCLKTSNAIYFRKPLDLVFECLPMIVFATCLFGYMVFLIFYKWSIDWNNGVDGMFGPMGGVRAMVFVVGGVCCWYMWWWYFQKQLGMPWFLENSGLSCSLVVLYLH